MTDIAGLEVQLDLDDGRFTSSLTRAGVAVRTFGRSVDSQSTSLAKMQRSMDAASESMRQMTNLAKGFVAFEVIKSSLGSLVDAQRSMQQIQYGLQGALGSADQAAVAFKYISEESDKLGLNLQVTATEFTKVTAAATAMGVPMSQQRQLFDALARSQTVMHLSTDQVKYSTMALAQMFGKGKIQAEELRRQLGEQIPGVVPRFQNAVMAMTKGTDLAGKSFDQLLQAGLITTDKFLPALIQALQETGAGAEEASQGLNANLNRLASAWFKLKTEMSSGLFTSVVSDGAGLLARNLEKIADAATFAAVAIGGILVSRQFGPIAENVIGQAKTFKVLQEALIDSADSSVIAAKRQVDLTAQKVKDLEVTQLATAEERAHATAIIETANAQIAAAKASLMQTQDRMLMGMPFDPAAVKKAEEDIIAAEARRGAAITRTAELGIIAGRVENQLTEAKAAGTVATEALTVAERNRQAMTFANTLSAGLKSLSTGLLTLVGGPWGAALLAVGGLGMALYTAHKNAEMAREAFDKQVKSLAELRVHIDNVIASYNKLGSGTSLATVIEEWKKANGQVDDAQKKIDDLRGKIQLYQAQIKYGTTAMHEGAGVNVAAAAQNLAEAQKELKKLQDQAEPSRQKFLQLQGTLKSALDPEVFNRLLEAAKKADDGASFDKIIAGLKAVDQQAIASANAMRALSGGIDDELWKKKVALVRKQQGEYAAWLMEEGKKINEAPGGLAGMSPADRARFNQQAAEMQRLITLTNEVKDAKKEETKAEKEAAKAKQEHESQLNSLIDRLNRQKEIDQEQLEANRKLLPAERIRAAILAELESATNRLTKAEGEALLKKADGLIASEKAAKAAQDEVEAKRQLAELQERLNGQLSNAQQANDAVLSGIGQGSQEQDRQERLLAIQREYYTNLKQMEREHKNDSQALRDEEAAKIHDSYMARLDQERSFQEAKRKMEADWTNGVRAGLEEWTQAANNMAANMKQVTTDFMNGMTDAITNMVTTGKASFKDLFTSLLKEITRVLMAKALSKLVGMVVSLWGGSDYTGGGGGGGSFNGLTGGGTYTGTGSMSLGAYGYADGGIHSASGPLPLHAYSTGGIAKNPQLALFGEGRLPEAYVPLPDGRSIPVTMSGGGGMSNTVQVNVNVDNAGQSTTETKADSTHGRQLGELIGAKIKETMAQEMRQGGMLWKMRYSNG